MSTRTGLVDGLGGNVVQAGSQAGLPTQDVFITGSVGIGGPVTVASSITATTTINATTNISGTGSIFGGNFSTPNNVLFTAGSPWGKGSLIQMTARSNITGGMFVSASGGLALAAAVSTMTPIGVALPGTNVASGGTVIIVVQGVVPVIAEGTVTIGNGAMMGAGAALNAVTPYVNGSGKQYPVIQEAGSEGVAFILIQ